MARKTEAARERWRLCGHLAPVSWAVLVTVGSLKSQFTVLPDRVTCHLHAVGCEGDWRLGALKTFRSSLDATPPGRVPSQELGALPAARLPGLRGPPGSACAQHLVGVTEHSCEEG